MEILALGRDLRLWILRSTRAGVGFTMVPFSVGCYSWNDWRGLSCCWVLSTVVGGQSCMSV